MTGYDNHIMISNIAHDPVSPYDAVQSLGNLT